METKKTGAPEGAPDNSLKTQRKDTYSDQFRKCQVAFYAKPSTMMEVARQVGCDRANVCWYLRDLRRAGRVWLIRKGTCPITRWDGVGFWSTNEKYAEGQPKQLELFPL